MTDSPTQQPPKQLDIAIDDIANIFQLTDPALFFTAKTAGEFDMDRQNVNFVLAEMGSEFAGILSKTEKTSDLKISLAARETGEFFYFATYAYELPSGDIEYRMTFTMSKSTNLGTEEAPEYHVEPFLVCNGTFDDYTITLNEMIARLPDDANGPRMMYAENEQQFYGLLQYANEFFLNMLRGREPSIEKLAELLKPEALAQSQKKHDAIKSRTRFDANELAEGNDEDDRPFMFHYHKMETLFQLDNHGIYFIPEDDDCIELVKNTRDLLKLAGSAYVRHLDEGITFTNRRPLMHQNSRNDSILYLPYSHTDLCGVTRDYEIMVVTITIPDQTTTTPDATVSMPIAVIVAEVDYDSDTYIPLEAICKVDQEKFKRSYLQLTLSDSFVSALCYAEMGMECVLIDNGPIRYRDLMPWLYANNFREAVDRHNYISVRKAAGLAASLEELRKNGVPQFQDFVIKTVTGTTYTLDASPVPEGCHLN